ncbi:tetratricopeptide repeat protein [bacterium]|nr:tetratricopeptide repeat protein [bacterium]
MSIFKDLFLSKEEKIRIKIDEHLAEGMRLMADKFYNGAMIEFEKAMALSPEDVYPRLVSELSNAAASGDLQSALAIGLNLIKENNEDYELANKLGNYAREMGDFKQAEGLYKTALKVNKGFQKAFYNLAASQARVNIYDDAIVSAISTFDKVENYILPDYLGDEKVVESLTELATTSKKAIFQERLQQLTIERDKKTNDGDTVEAKGIDLEINKLNEGVSKIVPEDILNEFDKQIESDPDNAKTHLYNKALYAIYNKMTDKALEIIGQLSPTDFDTVDLLHAILLEQKGKRGEAITKMNNLLGKNEFNRYNNVNLGLMYRRDKKKFLSTKYLIKTAVLLDKSNGLYSMKELIKEADECFEAANLKKALNYYIIAASELPSPRIWNQIGTIYIERKKYDEAVEAFRELAKMDPTSEIADKKLKDIHDYYADKAESLMLERKFKPASDYLHKALGVLRLPDTIKQAASVYKQLNDTEKEKELLEEWQKMMDDVKIREQEETRQKLIAQGKQELGAKNYKKAIETFEAVLRMKVDKKIFVQLAALYKGLKKRDELSNLENRWEKMVLHDEKIKKYEKEQERKQQGTEQES